MRQGIFRALLVLALLAPLSRLSFGDTLFVVSGSLDASGDLETVGINSPSFTFDWTSGHDFSFGQGLTVGEYAVANFLVAVDGNCHIYPNDPFGGYECEGLFNVVSAPFLVEASSDGGLDETGIPITWTAEIDADYEGTLLYEVDMAGVGTLTLTGAPGISPGGFMEIGVADNLIGVGDISPEPNTLTLMGTGLIAIIVVMGFRRRYSNAN
jgi:hypothetical protein